MSRRRSTDWVARPALTGVLSSDHAVVAVVGPIGSGRSSLLADWAADRDDVHWVEDGQFPEVTAGALVVDDAEDLPEAAWARLVHLVEKHPELSLRVAATTATVFPPQWDVEWVTGLNFSRAEIGDYLHRVGSSVDPAVVEFVTGGHPASVRQAAKARTNDVDQLRAALVGRGARSVLPADVRHLALPDHLDTPLVERLGGPSAFLHDAERAGLGRWWGAPGTRVFELVPFVREASRAALALSDPQRRAIHATAADVLLRSGAAFAAFCEAMAADDLDTADLALKTGGMPLLRHHGVAIMQLLRPQPLSRLRKYPVLALALALVFNARATHRLRAVELLGVALVGARLGAGRPADRALLRLVESAALRVIGAGDGGVKAARRTLVLLQGLEPTERPALGCLEPTLRNHAAVSLYYGGAEHEAREQWELVLTLQPETATELSALGGIAAVDALRGDVHAARPFVARQLERPWPRELLDEYAGSWLRLAQARVALDDFDFEGAARALDTIWPIVDTIEHWPLMAHLRALVDIGTGQAAVGLEEFRALRGRRVGRFGTSAPVGALLTHTEILLLVAAGRLAEARRTAAGRSGAVHHVVLALVNLYAGEHQAALANLAQSTVGRPRERMLQSTLEAVVLHRLGHRERSIARAEVARALAHAHGVRTPLLMLPDDADEVLGDLMDGIPRRMGVTASAPVLTPRELVVLRQLARTANVRLIAGALQVSENTVKSQRRSLYRKLAAGSREEALAAALVHGLLEG